jgi:hypothetical protein
MFRILLRSIWFHNHGQLFIALGQNIPNLNFYSHFVSYRLLWLQTRMIILLVNDVKICQQRYFKKRGIIVWTAGKNEYPLFNKVVLFNKVICSAICCNREGHDHIQRPARDPKIDTGQVIGVRLRNSSDSLWGKESLTKADPYLTVSYSIFQMAALLG